MQNRFKKGDRVVIIANDADHLFDLGERVQIVEVNFGADLNDVFYMAENDAGDRWAVNSGDIASIVNEPERFTRDEAAFIIGAMTLFVTVEGGLPYIDLRTPAVQRLIASGEKMRKETGTIDVIRATAMFEGIVQKLVDNSDLE